MKKLISIFLCMSMLCACSGMKGLRRQSTTQLHKNIKENNEWYYNAEDGHNENVKMFVKDKYHAQIKIPVHYTEHIEPLPKKLPQILSTDLQSIDWNNIDMCERCEINQNELTIDLSYNGMTLNNNHVSITNPWRKKTWWKSHGLTATLEIFPNELNILCDKKSCQVLDSEEHLVNAINIHKTIAVDKQKIAQSIKEEELAEIQRKQEEAKRKAEEDRKWRQKQRQQKKECPHLYRILYTAQQGYYVDPLLGITAAKRFEELDCGFWLNLQMNQAMY